MNKYAIHLWSTTKLAMALKENLIGYRERLFYFLTGQILSVLLLYFPLLPFSADSFTKIECAIITVITIIGALMCFRANGGINNSEKFFERFFCLAVPATIVVTVVYHLLFNLFPFALHYYYPNIEQEIFHNIQLYAESVTAILTDVTFFFLIWNSLRKIS